VAAFGLTFVTSALLGQQLWLRLGGGVFLCYLGAKTFLSVPAERPAAARGDGLLAAYASTLALTLTNPTTILSFVAIFAGLGAGMAGDGYASAAVLVAGVFAGSALWWLLLSGGVGVVRGRLDARRLRWVNRLSGLVIGAFGVLALLSVWR
jgi:threonine/homoserine/homoserine lactone efflux protein